MDIPPVPVFVHGLPETSQIWDPLRMILDRESIALALPGFATLRGSTFSATKDAYAVWLADALREIGQPIDLVGHDLGALISLRVATTSAVPLRSYVADVAAIFHPAFVWPQRISKLQTPGVGEDLLRAMREADPVDPHSTAARLVGAGLPSDEARAIGAMHDETMSRSILDFYRSAIPNVASEWWKGVKGPTRAPGLILLLPDPPETDRMSVEVARKIGAQTVRLNDLKHCWMAQAPELVAAVLGRFWSSLG